MKKQAGKKKRTINANKANKTFQVTGRLIDNETKHGIAYLRVQAWDRDMRSKELLGEAITDERGYYEIEYTAEKFLQNEKGSADLVFQVFSPEGTQLGISKIISDGKKQDPSKFIPNAPPKAKVDLIVKKPEEVKLSEYKLFLSKLTPLMEKVPLEDLTDDDIDFLAGETGIDRQRVEILRQGAKLSLETRLPAEAFYGWARQDISLNLEKLLAIAPEDLRKALETSIEANVISSKLRESLDSIMNRIEQMKLEHGLLVRRKITAKLLNQETGAPLSGFTAHAFDLDAGAEPVDIGYDITDGKGGFTLVYITARSEGEKPVVNERRLRVHILDTERKEIYQKEIFAEPDKKEVLEVPVPVPAVPELSTHILTELITTLKLELPEELITSLAEKGIHTLGDIRKAGGIRNIEGFQLDGDQPAVRTLEAHANLGRLASDVELNAMLIEKGFRSVYDIAESPRELFVAAAHKKLDDFKAAQMHVKAQAQTKFLDNILTGLRVNSANGFKRTELPELGSIEPYLWCSCKDCEAAVSPLAYLADLLDYATKHLKNKDNDEPISLQFLTSHFHQPFGQLPTSCKEMNNQVHQVRICIEVLRSVSREEKKDYLLAAYTMLLNKIGTSYEEIREASTTVASTDEEDKRKALAARKALADRLGIDISESRPDNLDALFLDPSANPTALNALKESNLEKLFGLVDTTRNPLMDSRIPDLQTWRLQHLRTLWKEQDWPTDPYSEGLLPIIDPDVIGPDDFRKPDLTNKAFSIWIARRKWIDDRLNKFESMRKLVMINNQQVEMPDMEAMLNSMYQPIDPQDASTIPWKDAPLPDKFDSLFEDLIKSADPKAAENANKTIQEKMHLTMESFIRLIAIHTKDQLWNSNTKNEKVSIEEWKEVHSILMQAEKVYLNSKWIAEEAQNIRFGLEDFWISLREPKEGDWPPLLQEQANRPFIDPESMKLEDLPEPTVGREATQLWKARNTILDGIKKKLMDNQKAGFDAMLKYALGLQSSDTLPDLLKLNNDLNNPNTATDAQVTITNDLGMTVDDFTRLMPIIAKSNDPDPSKNPSPAEWAEVYSILTKVRKKKIEFPDWIAQEQNLGMYNEYWRALKARLPQWRATAENRQEWQQALLDRSRSPIVDPDLINTGHLKSGPANDLWNSRSAWIGDQLKILKKMTVMKGIDVSMQTSLGVSGQEMESIAIERDMGNTITTRLKQLNLEGDSFSYILRIRNLVMNGAQVMDSEWDEFHNILVQVMKCREFANWRDIEKQRSLILSPDYFKIPELLQVEFIPKKPDLLPVWRATWGAHREWEEILQSRIDQEKAAIDGLKEAIDSTEEATLPILRDALINTSHPPGKKNLEDKADWITDNFLIDARAGGCQKTTRIAQAIETIQNLLQSVRNDKKKDIYKLKVEKFEAKDFEEKWKWIGSYSTWRAAMLVFLYPEDILLPSLRRYQTPAFGDMVDNLRTNQSLTEENSYDAAKAYSDYFNDVCNLVVEATCQTNTRISKNKSYYNLPKEIDHSSSIYMFGRGGVTKKVYWSMYDWLDDVQNKSGHAQTFWEVVSGLENVNVIKIVGAVPYSISPEKRFIYLFLLTQEGENYKKKLIFTRYDLEKRMWINEKIQLRLPVPYPFEAEKELYEKDPTVTIRDIIAVQTLIEDKPPEIAFKTYYHTYIRSLNLEASDWEAAELPSDSTPITREWNEWENFRQDDNSGNWLSIHKLHAVLMGFDDSGKIVHWIFYSTFKDNIMYGSKSDKKGPVKYLGQNPWSWIGAFLSGYIYVFYQESGNTVCRIFDSLNGEEIGFSPTIPGLDKIIPMYRGESAIGHQYVYHRMTAQNEASQEGYFRCTFSMGNIMPGIYASRIVPFVKGPYDIPPRIPEGEIQNRRSLIKQAFENNTDGPQSNLDYLKEAYYFVPINLALQLQRRRAYTAALDWFCTVYNYNMPEHSRKIYYGLDLELEQSQPNLYQRTQDWLLDPMNPHSIAETRPNTYIRFTLLSIIRCLLEFADTEFTLDTVESIPRARNLYMTALDLLESPELKQESDFCRDLIDTLDIQIGDTQWIPFWNDIVYDLSRINHFPTLEKAVQDIKEVMASDETIDIRLAEINKKVVKIKASLPKPHKFEEVLNEKADAISKSHASLLALPAVAEAIDKIGAAADQDVLYSASSASSGSAVGLEHDIWDVVVGGFIPAPSYHFCIPLNPILKELRLRAELNLYKLRNCRNIAGLKRQLEPYAAPTDITAGIPAVSGQIVLPDISIQHKILYHYNVLVGRAKELVQFASQIEASMLSALMKRDEEDYTLMKARQDMDLAQAGMNLQNVRFTEAFDGVILATLQCGRAQIQKGHFEMLLNDNLSDAAKSEATWLDRLNYLTGLREDIAKETDENQGYRSTMIDWRSMEAQKNEAYASIERREQEWQFQKSLASQDIAIGNQQIQIANDHLKAANQEFLIAGIQAKNARDTLEFLANKFLKVELFDWMSNVLERVYGYFLQQATSMAKSAESQLAFERQEISPSFIRADYWEAHADGLVEGSIQGKTPDRRGLTGSARLLQDIYQLDQYAFETNKRKLQLTKTISLARLAPAEFQRFTETGMMTFATPMEMFDRDFPGHYLRLIKRVRTLVVALIPPMQGIHATLSTTGISRVVVGDDVFKTIPIRRDPEFVALSSPSNTTGLFELEPQSDMLMPFEGSGVDTFWEFQMPKASNLFDYSTIADVLITIEYTALNSFDYRQQVIQTLKPTLSADRPFSFRDQFADQWYDLHNPDQTATPMVVRFDTCREDFPPNIENLKIQHVVLYFARASGKTFEVPVTNMRFTEQGSNGKVGGGATSIDGVISTRRGNAGSWMSMIGKMPAGEWELALSEEMKDRFKNEEIEDILFVITYSGRTPEWPT